MNRMRDAVLRGLVLFGVSLVAVTELLGAVHLLSRGPLFLAWTALLLVALWRIARARETFRPARFSYPALDCLIAAGIAVVMGVTLATALVSPPNSADAMAYHMPRVVYWAQAGSVA